MIKSKILYMLLLFSLFSACSTARFKYVAEIEDTSGKINQFEFEKSYNVKTDAILCGVTGILYGGWCWTYLFMPSSSQKELLENDAKVQISSRLNSDSYKIKNLKISKVNWSSGEDVVLWSGKKEAAIEDANCSYIQDNEMEHIAYVSPKFLFKNEWVEKFKNCGGHSNSSDAFPRIAIDKNTGKYDLDIYIILSSSDWYFLDRYVYKYKNKLTESQRLHRVDSNVERYDATIREHVTFTIPEEHYKYFIKNDMVLRVSGKRGYIDFTIPSIAFKDSFEKLTEWQKKHKKQ